MTKKILSYIITALLLIAAMNYAVAGVTAQTQATVVVLDSVGGTVDPSGTNTYAGGTVVTLTATPTDPTYVFSNWIITSDSSSTTDTDNPLSLTVTGGVTYAIQAVFQPTVAIKGGTLPTNLAAAAIIVILPSAGGTTNPPPGRYALENATDVNIQATASSGWQFSHWIISGASTDHGGAPVNLEPTANPYNINHGYGYTYNYQAVFTQTSGTGTTPTPPSSSTPTPTGTLGGLTTDNWIEIALVAVIIVILIAFGVFASRRRR